MSRSYQSINASDNGLEIEEKAPKEGKATKYCVYITAGIVALTVLCAFLFVEDYTPEDEPADVVTTDVLTQFGLSDETAVCNDQTPAYMYYRASPTKETRWVIYLEGSQTFCFNQSSCDERWEDSSQYMSSKDLEETREWGGVVSQNETINPDWYNANHVAVPSCTSDLYIGDATLEDGEESGITWSFLGYRVMHTVFLDLIDKFNLLGATDILLTGNGGGGVGTLVHIDHLADMLKDRGWSGTLKGMPDTSVMIDADPYEFVPCTGGGACAISTSFVIAEEYWNYQSPWRCTAENYEDWECLVAQYTMHTIETPILAFQWLQEKSQMTLLGVSGRPSGDSMDYCDEIADMYVDIFDTELPAGSGYFAPACYAHELVHTDEWGITSIDGYFLPDALREFWAGNPVRLADDCRGSLDCNPTCL